MFCVDAANLHNIMNSDLRKFGEWMPFIMLSSKLLLKRCTSLSTTKHTYKIIYFSDYIHMNALCTTPSVYIYHKMSWPDHIQVQNIDASAFVFLCILIA